MAALVLDASVALSWFFKDEANALAKSVFAMLEDEQALVPYHWHAEVANGMIVGERRGRTERFWIERFIESLGDFDLLVESPGAESRAMSLIPLAQDHHLTIYDALYLDLALRRQLPLATLDGPLRQAAEKAGVEIIRSA